MITVGDAGGTVVVAVAVVVASRATLRSNSRHVLCLLTVRTTCAATKVVVVENQLTCIASIHFIDSTKIPKYPKRMQDGTLSS